MADSISRALGVVRRGQPTRANTQEVINVTITVSDSLLNSVRLGDMRDLSRDVPDSSVDLIFTDPPYLHEFIYLYGELARVARRVLKPCGFCLVYCGVVHLERVVKLMAGLEYFYSYILVHRDAGGEVLTRLTRNDYKMVLAYRLAGSVALPQGIVDSVVVGSGMDKRYHEWGQDVGSAEYFIKNFSAVGGVVYDPFVGGGTSAVAAMGAGRQFIVSDLDVSAYRTTLARVNALRMAGV